ncbi:hypothetical protein LWI29_029486 [Acer saccharum]|uniref:F-box domain-containing protein n=1 Tax=Acer saccharum TaxID=4024 RepID=A0AA39SAB7_ACESA|nr:hypothetical protein LWI29_029486 [Acer saccharum]
MKRARDRLSNLPNPIIYNILSLMDTKYAVRTCVLSKKWLFHWRYIHSLNFDPKTFTKVSTFRKFVLHVLRRRRPFGVRGLKLLIAYTAKSRNSSVEKKVFDYVASYGGLEELETNLDCWFPESIVHCQSLKTLKLSTYSIEDLQDSFDFASLTTLQLSGTSFSQTQNNSFDIFSTCLNLENLILIKCSSYGREIFEISAPRLINLSISGFGLLNTINKKTVISAPSLVNLNISNLRLQGANVDYIKDVVVISAPRLKFFNFRAKYRLTLSIEKCSSLEKMNIRVFPPVAWRETYNGEQGHMFDLLCITEGSYRAKSIDIVFRFSKVIKF